MKLNFNFDGKTFLSKWWKIVRDNFTAIQTDHNTLSDKLDTEITQRTNADVGLANQVTAEKTARESADSSLSSRINNEVTIRQAADNELQRNIDSEITERQTADSKKADKTELYGTDETTKHTVTYSLTAADMAVSIDAGHSIGTVTVSGNTVKSKILLDGYSIQAADLSATFGCGKGEDGDKYICIYYSPETGTLTMTVEDVETSPEEGTVALMTVGYNTATVTTMYNRAQTFTGINNLNGLKTNNKNSFLEAVNEIATKLTTEMSDREDAEHSLTEKISTEISDRQAADNELKAKISEINTELTTDNLFYDLSKYVNSDNKLVTDDSGVQYLSYSGSFENGTYLYHNFVVDNFRRKPKTETALELTFNVASRHIAGDGCDIGVLNIGETDVLITYTDTTTERFGQSYYTATDTGDKTITINGTSETYKTTKFKIEIPVKKEIKSISFRIVSDNFYTNGDPTGNACKQKTLIQSAVCYDDECVAVLRDDINANTSKITANTTKLTTEISDRQAADDELKAKFTDLKTVAFTGSYTDLSNKPTSMQNPNSLTLTMNGSSSSYNGSATASKSWYAPTSAGSTGYNLISNGSGAPVWQQPPYAVCNTATTTAAKTVSITNFKLITGARVLVKFTYAHKSSGSATLNISNTGAKTICIEKPDAPYGNSSFSITSITSQNSWQAGDILDLVYNGTYWCVIGSTGFLQSGRYSSNVIIGTEENNLGAYCDYICDGSNDQTIIQQAINDLPSTGGKIVLLEGVYNISEELTLPYPITFEGTVNTSLCVLSQGLLRHDINNISVSNTATFKDININFMSGTNDSEGYVGAFENFKLTFENCTITKRTSYQSVQRLFLNCKVKMINTDVDITMPNSGFGAPYDCFWVFGESTVELLNTHIWLTGENPVNNGVFYDSKGTMTGGWITNTKKDTSNHGKSYILHSSPITFLGTQIRCREFAQEWNSNTSNGFSPSLDSCKIEILDGGDFSCSHASHIDLVLSSSSKTSVISAYALISNSKLFITFDHQLELRDYAFLEACYVNRVNYKASGSASSAKTTDTSTVTSMAKPIFIDTEGNK